MERWDLAQCQHRAQLLGTVAVAVQRGIMLWPFYRDTRAPERGWSRHGVREQAMARLFSVMVESKECACFRERSWCYAVSLGTRQR